MDKVKTFVLEMLAELENKTVDELLHLKEAWIEFSIADGSYPYMKRFIDEIIAFELKQKTKIA